MDKFGILVACNLLNNSRMTANGFIKDYCNVKDRGKKLTKFFNRSEETMHLFLLKEMTFL